MTNNKKIEKIKIFPFAVDMPSCLKVCAHCNDCLKQYVWEPHKLNVVMYYRNEKDEYVEWKPKEVLNSLLQEIEEKVIGEDEWTKKERGAMEPLYSNKNLLRNKLRRQQRKALKTIKERYLDGNESKGGVNNG